MTVWNKLRRLSLRELGLLSAASGLVMLSEISIRILPAKHLLRLLQRTSTLPPKQQTSQPDHLARFVNIADRYLPGNASCLRRAAALQGLFALHGIGADLYIGVRRDQHNLHAHAWLETADGNAYGQSEEPAYVPLTRRACPPP